MKRGGLASILLIAVLAVVLGGCGDDSETASSLTKAQFLKQAEVVCHLYESEKEEVLNRELQEAGSNPSVKEQEELLIAVLKPYERMAERLAELGLPEGNEQKTEAMIESVEEAIRKAKADPESVFTTNLPFEEANKQVEANGLDNCVA